MAIFYSHPVLVYHQTTVFQNSNRHPHTEHYCVRASLRSLLTTMPALNGYLASWVISLAKPGVLIIQLVAIMLAVYTLDSQLLI